MSPLGILYCRGEINQIELRLAGKFKHSNLRRITMKRFLAATLAVMMMANLCYRCKNGKRPQVMVFTRSTNATVVNLIDQLDAAIAKNESKQLRAFVNVLGDSRGAATKGVKSIATASKAKNVPFVLPNEYENGPDNYQLNPEAEVTILVCNNHKVFASHAVSSAKELDVKKILESVTGSLK